MALTEQAIRNFFTADNFRQLSRKDVNLNAVSAIYRYPKWLAILEVMQFLALVGGVYYYNPFEITTTYPGWTATIILLVAFIFVTLFFFLRTKVAQELNAPVDSVAPTEWGFVKKMVITGIAFVGMIGLTKALVVWGATTSPTHLIHAGISLLLFIGLLGIVYLLVSPLISSSSTRAPVLRLLWDLIMYLPCLLLVLLAYGREQLKITTSLVWIILTLEGLFILLFFILPAAVSKWESSAGVHLLRAPVYLNQEHVVGSFETLYASLKKITDTRADVDPLAKTVNYKYALSAWFYINPQPPSTSGAYTTYTPILNYGYKPVVEYNGRLNSLRVLASTANAEFNPNLDVDAPALKAELAPGAVPAPVPAPGGAPGAVFAPAAAPAAAPQDLSLLPIIGVGEAINMPAPVPADTELDRQFIPKQFTSKNHNQLTLVYETTDILYQKWNNIGINYDAGLMDVLLNGELVASKSGIVPYMTHDTVVAGHDAGIYGGICNVMYYPDVMSKSTITAMYKLFRDNEYPVL